MPGQLRSFATVPPPASAGAAPPLPRVPRRAAAPPRRAPALPRRAPVLPRRALLRQRAMPLLLGPWERFGHLVSVHERAARPPARRILSRASGSRIGLPSPVGRAHTFPPPVP